MLTDATDYIMSEINKVKGKIKHTEQQDIEHGLACAESEIEILRQWLTSLRTITAKIHNH